MKKSLNHNPTLNHNRREIYAFIPVVRGANKLEVRNESDTAEIVLIGAVGKSWWDDTGITEQEFRDALKTIPSGKRITVSVNSEGGSVKEGLGIYNAIKDRRADITCKITGYALSIASVFPLAADKVVSPKSAIWMIHKAWSWAQGNADDMRQQAEMLDTHDETLAGIYAEHTGKSQKEILKAMEEETWIKGADAVAWGLATETDETESADAAAYRPLAQTFLDRCKNISPAILNTLRPDSKTGRDAATSAAPNGGQQTPTQPQDHTMKKSIVALLTKHGLKDPAGNNFTEDSPEAELQAALATLETKKLQQDSSADNLTDLAAIRAELKAQKEQRLSDKIAAYVDAQRITKAQAKVYLAQALVSATAETDVFAALEETQAAASGDHAGPFITIVDSAPNISKSGVQGNKIIPELENIFTAHKLPDGATREQQIATATARYNAMKAEFPQLLAKAFAKDRGSVQAGNTFSGTITTNFLIMGVIVKLYNRFAPATLFTMDSEQDPYKPLAAGIRKFNTTTTDGTKVGKNVTNFETLAGASNGNPDSTIDAITITPDQYTSGGFLTNAQLNSGFRISDLVEAKLIDLADKVTQVITAPITVANFVTNAPLIQSPGAFGFSDLATLQGQIKKFPIKNLLLDGEYQARIANTPGFFQSAGLVGGVANAWRAFGWENVAMNTEWSGAGANVRGFATAPQSIGIISGLPLNPPEGIPGNIVQTGVAQLPDVQKAIATYAWFSPQARTFFFTFDIILGATLIDETAGVLIKSA